MRDKKKEREKVRTCFGVLELNIVVPGDETANALAGDGTHGTGKPKRMARTTNGLADRRGGGKGPVGCVEACLDEVLALGLVDT